MRGVCLFLFFVVGFLSVPALAKDDAVQYRSDMEVVDREIKKRVAEEEVKKGSSDPNAKLLKYLAGGGPSYKGRKCKAFSGFPLPQADTFYYVRKPITAAVGWGQQDGYFGKCDPLDYTVAKGDWIAVKWTPKYKLHNYYLDRGNLYPGHYGPFPEFYARISGGWFKISPYSDDQSPLKEKLNSTPQLSTSFKLAGSQELMQGVYDNTLKPIETLRLTPSALGYGHPFGVDYGWSKRYVDEKSDAVVYWSSKSTGKKLVRLNDIWVWFDASSLVPVKQASDWYGYRDKRQQSQKSITMISLFLIGGLFLAWTFVRTPLRDLSDFKLFAIVQSNDSKKKKYLLIVFFLSGVSLAMGLYYIAVDYEKSFYSYPIWYTLGGIPFLVMLSALLRRYGGSLAKAPEYLKPVKEMPRPQQSSNQYYQPNSPEPQNTQKAKASKTNDSYEPPSKTTSSPVLDSYDDAAARDAEIHELSKNPMLSAIAIAEANARTDIHKANAASNDARTESFSTASKTKDVESIANNEAKDRARKERLSEAENNAKLAEFNALEMKAKLSVLEEQQRISPPKEKPRLIEPSKNFEALTAELKEFDAGVAAQFSSLQSDRDRDLMFADGDERKIKVVTANYENSRDTLQVTSTADRQAIINAYR